MLGPRFQRAEHLRPALAIAVGGAERALVLAPALFGDLDERAPVVERLEAHRHLGAIIAVLLLAALDIVGLAFARLPFEDDLLVLDHLDHPDRKGARKIVEIPRHRRAGLESRSEEHTLNSSH